MNTSIPDGWTRARVGSIASEIRYGYTASASDHDGHRFLRITDIQNGHVDWTSVPGCSIDAAEVPRYLLRHGDIVFARTGATTGKSYLLHDPPPAVFASYLIRLRLQPGVADPAYVFWFFQSRDYWQQIERKKRGIGQPGVNATSLAEVELPLAPPRDQKVIVSELEKHFTRLDAAVASLKQAQAKLKAYRAAVLAAAVQGDLTPGTKRSTVGDLPSGWRWIPMSELGDGKSSAIFAGPFGTLFKARDFRPTGVPIVFLRHVAPGRYLTHKPGFMDEMKWRDLFQPYSVYGGELLVTKLGEPPGACAMYPAGMGPAMVTPDVIAMRVNHKIADPSYLMHYLNSHIARRIAFGLAFGTTRLRLTLPLFRSLRVPLPPLDVQRNIVAEVDRRLSVADHCDSAIDAELQRAARLRNAILRAAFSGELSSIPDRSREAVEAV